MATEVCRDKTLDSRHSNETTSAPLRHHPTEWRAFQKRKLCCRTLYYGKYGKFTQNMNSHTVWCIASNMAFDCLLPHCSRARKHFHNISRALFALFSRLCNEGRNNAAVSRKVHWKLNQPIFYWYIVRALCADSKSSQLAGVKVIKHVEKEHVGEGINEWGC